MAAILEPVKNLADIQEFDNHKAVYRFEDAANNLRGFIAIHNDNLGPATGGTRMFPYANEKEALADVLKLSRAMTYKCALAGVRHGGGKAVIIGNPDKDKNEELLRSYARIINKLEGIFTTGEDSGITEDDVQIMFEESDFFNGRRGVAGDPSPYAALSTFYTIQVALAEITGINELFNIRIAIKGIGKVGAELLKLLVGAGAEVVIADIKTAVTDAVKARFPQVKVADPEVIHGEPAEVFSPCALGNDITDKNVYEISAKIICGAANNQLASPEVGDLLFKRNIFYVPDYVANAGGLINVMDERDEGGYNKKRVLHRIEHLRDTLRTIYLFSQQRREPPYRVADRLAEDIFLNGKTPSFVA